MCLGGEITSPSFTRTGVGTLNASRIFVIPAPENASTWHRVRGFCCFRGVSVVPECAEQMNRPGAPIFSM